jgi:hypothetical protein
MFSYLNDVQWLQYKIQHGATVSTRSSTLDGSLPAANTEGNGRKVYTQSGDDLERQKKDAN